MRRHEGHRLALDQLRKPGRMDDGSMDEYVVSAIVGNDEAEALGLVILNPAVEGHDHPLNAAWLIGFGADFSMLARPEGAAARVAGPARVRGGTS